MDQYALILLVFELAMSGRAQGDCVSHLQNRLPAAELSPLVSLAQTYLGTNPAIYSSAQVSVMSGILSALATALQPSS